jgi:hypothetical protein
MTCQMTVDFSCVKKAENKKTENIKIPKYPFFPNGLLTNITKSANKAIMECIGPIPRKVSSFGPNTDGP